MSPALAISRVAIVDDQPQSRKTYGYTVSNADLEPISVGGPLGSLDEFLRSGQYKESDAALCDYRLNMMSYAGFTGADLVAAMYEMQFPAILCTQWEKTQVEAIRPLRRWIPVLVKPRDLDVDSLLVGLEACVAELQGDFSPVRRPWRNQIHFVAVDEESPDELYAEIPGWDAREIIRVRRRDLPASIRETVQPGFRCHAMVNLGATEAEDLYICDWESA